MANELRVRDVMNRNVLGVSEEFSLRTAAKTMVEKGINSLVVWPADEGEPYGIVTSSDLVDAMASGSDFDERRVADFRTTPLVLVTPGVKTWDAARLMARQNLRHLVVFNGRKVVGILSSFDLLKAVAESPRGATRPADLISSGAAAVSSHS